MAKARKSSKAKPQPSTLRKGPAPAEIFGRLAEYPWPNHFFYAHDRNGVFFYVSPSIKEVLGFTPAEFCVHFTKYLTDNPLNQEAIRRTSLSIQGVCQPPYELEIRDKKGRIRRLLAQEFPFEDSKGRVAAVAGIAWDITAQHRLEEELRASEKKYRTLVEEAGDAIFAVDAEGRFLFMNAAAASAVGGKPADYVGKTLWDIFPREIADRHMAGIRQALEAKRNLVVAEAMSILQGEKRWYHTILKPISGPGGKPAVMLMARDITARKQAEEELFKSEERYRYILENLNDIFFTCNNQGVVTYISAQVKRYGFKPEEIIGRKFLDFIAEEDRAEAEAEFARAMATHEHRVTRFRLRDARGEIHWLEENSHEIHSESGETIGLTGMIRDITERVRAEEALRLSEEKYRGVVDNVDIGIAIISPAMEIVALNNRMREWFPHVTPETKPICYRSFNQPPRAEVCSYCPVVQTFQDGKVHRAVTETPVGGETRNYRIIASPLRNAKGEVTAVIELVEDITEDRRLAERLTRSERLAVIGTLAAGVAHEFNNLNVSILGFADLALTSAELTPELRLCLEHIRNAARRGRNFTASLLGFASARDVRRSRGNLRAVISETVDLVWRQLEAAGVDVEMRLHPVPDTAMDVSQIGQIILNLLLNAKQALKNSAQKFIGIETGVHGNRIFVRVRDTGCGIPPENMERIFEPFFSTRQTAGEEAGSGLGLCVSRLIAESHGGALEVQSELGQGATFTLWLPIEEAPPAEARLPEAEWDGVDLAGMRILVIDDDPDTVELLSMFLGREHMTVAAESDAEVGGRRLQAENFDIVIVDLMMPGSGGVEFLKSLQGLPAATRPAAIVLTGRVERDMHEICRQMGAAEVLAKPFELAEILRCLKKAVVKRRNTQPGGKT